jgi:hypothetical protein
MQKQNDERQDAINLQKAEWELEKARNQKTQLIYTEGHGGKGQMVYTSDEKNVREQQQNLDNLQYELTIKAKQEEIDLVEQEIEKLNDEKQKYQDQIDAISKKIELLNEQKDANSEIIQNCAELFLDYLDEYGVEETKSIICSAYDSNNKEEQFKHLKSNYKNCIGYVRYECNSVDWRNKMKEMIESL